jgi:SAM-dependent methyltransferase
MRASRKMLFSDLITHLTKLSINPEKDITSVFEVGCSSGYQLRYLETDLFPSAIDLEGIDIDRYAIESGSEYLKSIRSKIRLMFADMEELSSLLRDKIYDIIICSGTLMYLNEESAFKIVNVMLSHTKKMLVLTGPAHPEVDNSLLEHSIVRNSDGSFIHNIDSMVKKAGGKIVARRWDGSNMVDGQSIYFAVTKAQS